MLRYNAVDRCQLDRIRPDSSTACLRSHRGKRLTCAGSNWAPPPGTLMNRNLSKDELLKDHTRTMIP